MDAFDIVLDLISQGSLYRGDQYKSDLEAFVALKKKYEVVPREERDNFCWVESAKVGYVGRIRNTAIGTLLVDITNGRDLDASAETKEQLFEAVDFICADEPNGLIGTTGKSFTADKLKRSINAAITGRFNANVVTRRYGLRQQVLYLMYYGIE